MSKHDDANATELPETKISCETFCNFGHSGSKYAIKKEIVNPHIKKKNNKFVTDYKCNLNKHDCGMLKVYNSLFDKK